jgi:hypothetical protein
MGAMSIGEGSEERVQRGKGSERFRKGSEGSEERFRKVQKVQNRFRGVQKRFSAAVSPAGRVGASFGGHWRARLAQRGWRMGLF